MSKYVVVLHYTDKMTGEERASPYGWMGKVEVLDTYQKAINYLQIIRGQKAHLSPGIGTLHIEPAEDHAALIMEREIKG